jgi:YVTN family beta-propeller protein
VKPVLLLLAVSCCLSAASAQSLEKTVYLPDSLSGLTGPTCLSYNWFNQTLYVAGEGIYVIAIDCSTGEKVARINVGGSVKAVCSNSSANKTYAALWAGRVVVIDGTSNTVHATLTAGNEPSAILYDSVVGKVYCANSGSDDVTVIDAVLDSVVATVTVGQGPAALCADPTGTKIYCALSDGGVVAVLDAEADTLLSSIQVGDGACALYCNSQRNKIYCANRSDRSVSVISTFNDSVVATVATARYPRAFGYDPTRDRLYVACENHEVAVLDCAKDTVLARVAVDDNPWDVLYNGANDRVYCANYSDQLVVIDAAADTVVKTLTIAGRPCALALDGDRDYVYCASEMGNTVSVIDANQDTVAATVATGCNLDFTVFSEKSNKLYVGCRFGTGGHLAVIDGTSNVVQRFIDIAGYGRVVCYDSSLDKVYVGGGGGSTLTAIDCARDSIVAAIAVPGGVYAGRTCSNPAGSKVYSTTGQGGTLTVVDAAGDTVITTIQLPRPMVMSYSPANNLVYVDASGSDSGSVFAIDGSGDTVVAEIYTGLAGGGSILLNPRTNTLYVADEINCDVAMIDCINNQFLGTLYAVGQPTAMCCDTHDNRIFVATRYGHNVWVFNGIPPRDMDSVPLFRAMGDIFYNPLSNRVYCAGRYVYVIDGTSKAVLDSFEAGMAVGVGQPAFALNPAASRVYALDHSFSRLLVIADTFHVGLQDGTATPDGRTRLPQTIVSKSLIVPGREKLVLLDISGRKVLELKAGANDIRHLAPGVYFLRETRAQAQAQAVRKVVVTR